MGMGIRALRSLTSLLLIFWNAQVLASGEIVLLFNHDPSTSYFESYRGFDREGQDFEAEILKRINDAQKSIHIAVHELRLPSISKALVEKTHQGVSVKLVLENQYNQTLAEGIEAYEKGDLTSDQFARLSDYIMLADLNGDGQVDKFEADAADAVHILRESGIELRDDTADGSKGSGLMHHKFMVLDGRSVLISSANFTLSDIHGDLTRPETRGNWNALLYVESQDLAQDFETEFSVLFGGGDDLLLPQAPPRFGVKKPYRAPRFSNLPGGGKIAVQFSPVSQEFPWEYSTNGVISRVIMRAERSVKGALFVFSDQKIAYNLDYVKEARNVEISFILEPRFAFQYYSEALDMLGLEMLSPRCKIEEGNQVWENPIESVGIPRLPRGDLLHHKFGVVDSRFILFGSHNWSNAANDLNDENLLIIDSPELASKFEEELNRLEEFTYWGAPDYLFERIKEREESCAFGASDP